MILTNETQDQLNAIEERIAMILKVLNSHNIAIAKIMAYVERDKNAKEQSDGLLQGQEKEEDQEK